MGNLFTPAYLTRRKPAVYLLPPLRRSPSPWPTRLCSIILPRSLFLPGTSTFPPQRPPDSLGETFGATRSTLTLSNEGRPRFNAQTHLELHQMFSECLANFLSNLNIQIFHYIGLQNKMYFAHFILIFFSCYFFKMLIYIFLKRGITGVASISNYPLRYCIC